MSNGIQNTTKHTCMQSCIDICATHILECRYQHLLFQGQPMTKKYTSMRITEERKIKLERAAIEVSYATGKQIKWTDLANHLFDEYVAEAKKDMKESLER